MPASDRTEKRSVGQIGLEPPRGPAKTGLFAALWRALLGWRDRGAPSPESILLGLLCLLVISLVFSGVDWDLRTRMHDGFLILKYHNIIVAAAGATAAAILLAGRSKFSWSPLYALLAAFLLAAWGGWHEAGDKGLFIDFMLRLLRGYAVIFCLAALPVAKRSLSALAWAAVAAGALGSIIAIAQELYLAISGQATFLSFVFTQQHYLTWRPFGLELIRVSALAGDPNYFGLLPASAIVILLFGPKERLRSWRGLLVLALCVIAVLLTFSRGVWLGLICLVLVRLARVSVDAVRRRKITGALVIGSVAAVLVCGATASLVVFRNLSDANASISLTARRMIIGDSLRTFASHPWFGVGLGNSVNYDWFGVVPHNLILEIATGTGILGLLVWVGIAALIIRQLAAIRSCERRTGDILEGIVVVMAGVSLTLDMTTLLSFWIVIGLVDHAYRACRRSPAADGVVSPVPAAA